VPGNCPWCDVSRRYKPQSRTSPPQSSQHPISQLYCRCWLRLIDCYGGHVVGWLTLPSPAGCWLIALWLNSSMSSPPLCVTAPYTRSARFSISHAAPPVITPLNSQLLTHCSASIISVFKQKRLSVTITFAMLKDRSLAALIPGIAKRL